MIEYWINQVLLWTASLGFLHQAFVYLRKACAYLWAKLWVQRFSLWWADLDVDDNGDTFPRWHMQRGDTCGSRTCGECFEAQEEGHTSGCYDAWYRSRTLHYARHKVARQFVA